MEKFKTIPAKEQENFIDNYWTMLRECESAAIRNNDRVLKHFVEQWYTLWNRVSGQKKAPVWGSAFDVSSF